MARDKTITCNECGNHWTFPLTGTNSSEQASDLMRQLDEQGWIDEPDQADRIIYTCPDCIDKREAKLCCDPT